MNIDIAKEDLWWLREALCVAIDHIEGSPNPDARAKVNHVARKAYKKLSIALKGWQRYEKYFPKGRDVKQKTLTVHDVSLPAMVSGGERKHPVVVHNGIVKRWVGIGWIEEGVAKIEDVLKYPVVAPET